MLGVSLSYKWLLGEDTAYGLNKDKALTELLRRGVDSIELRTVLPEDSREGVLSVAQDLWDMGFEISVHSRMYSAETAVSDVFGPLFELFRSLKQDKLVIVLHPIAADNVSIMRALADHIKTMGYPAVIALENNRLMPDESEGDSAAYVLDVVKKVARPEIRLCFDMGHYMYYLKKHRPDTKSPLPPEEFIKLMAHTHIHALRGLKTHYPLGEYDLPLRELLDGVCWGYFGAYNFEPDLPRWSDIEPLPAILSSVDVLRESLPPCARLYDEIRKSFDSGFKKALGVYEKRDYPYSGVALANSTFYLFNTNGFKWAMDPAFRYARHLAKSPSSVADLLSDVKLMVITHGHVDHFEEETVRALAKNDMKWVIPDFLYENAISWGILPENIITARENRSICIDKLTILPFEGRHFRPVSGQGVNEYGYFIRVHGGPTMAFPADVRDYSLDGLPHVPKADICFGHVWFGDGNSFDEEHSEIAQSQARFLLEFSDKHIVLAHLYENGRRDADMWREEHAAELSSAITAISKSTRITVPKLGDIVPIE